MTNPALSKRQQNVERTREKLLCAALELYASHSIDAVSLRQIGVAAGQKNPNALQYHFGDRQVLLQAIIDKHATHVASLREAYIERAEQGEWEPGEAAARCLVMPIIDYVNTTHEGIQFVKVVSQVAAIYQNGALDRNGHGIRFPENRALAAIFEEALGSLSGREAQRRIYLVVTNTFHSIADIYGNAGQRTGVKEADARKAMTEQLVLLLTAFFCAPALQKRTVD